MLRDEARFSMAEIWSHGLPNIYIYIYIMGLS